MGAVASGQRRGGHRGAGWVLEPIDHLAEGDAELWWWCAWRKWMRAAGRTGSEDAAREAIDHFYDYAWE